MIVDDHQLVIDGLSSLLKDNSNFEVIAAAKNGLDAVQMVEINIPDVVLMDIGMPVMNGIETTKKILEKNSEIKILAITMYSEKGMITKMVEAGASGYLLKNANKEELEEAINKVFSGQKYFSSEVTISILEKNSISLEPAFSNFIEKKLTDRELEVLKFIVNGLTNRQIADKLYISIRTVDTHRSNLMEKLKVKNIAALIRLAIKNGLLDG